MPLRRCPKPHTLDVVAGMMCAVMGKGPHVQPWLARSFDLKSVHRQYALHPWSRQFAYIIVGDPNTLTLKAFRLKALPSGIIKSVHSFHRIAHSLKWAIFDFFVYGDHHQLFLFQ